VYARISLLDFLALQLLSPLFPAFLHEFHIFSKNYLSIIVKKA
jgi:hypothetical protein